MKPKDLTFKGLVWIFEGLISCHKPSKQHKHHKPRKYPKKTKIIQSENQSQKCPEKTITTHQEKKKKKKIGEKKERKKIGVKRGRKKRKKERRRRRRRRSSCEEKEKEKKNVECPSKLLLDNTRTIAWSNLQEIPLVLLWRNC